MPGENCCSAADELGYAANTDIVGKSQRCRGARLSGGKHEVTLYLQVSGAFKNVGGFLRVKLCVLSTILISEKYFKCQALLIAKHCMAEPLCRVSN